MKLGDITQELVGKSIRVSYTHIYGNLDSFNTEYEDEVKIIVDGSAYYLPRDFEIFEYGQEEYHPSVLLGVVDPWSPID